YAAYTDLDNSTYYFGVYDGHGGGEVAKFCAKYLHQQMLGNGAYSAGDLATSVLKTFVRELSLITMDHLLDALFALQSSNIINFLLQMLEIDIVFSLGRVSMKPSMQAHNLSKDHKPDLGAEKERILNAGGCVQYGRVNGNLNLSRAIGDMDLKQNKLLPAEMQIVTAKPDITTVEFSDDDDSLLLLVMEYVSKSAASACPNCEKRS
ncbi:probable phosphatase 2C 60, partial [Olea europaea subsp. europaea]